MFGRYCIHGAFAIFMYIAAGCHAQMSLNSVAKEMDDLLSIGDKSEYILSIEGQRDIALTISFDKCNRCYHLDAGDVLGRFKGVVKKSKDERFWMSITVGDESYRRSMVQLTELEGGFVTQLYLSVVLELTNDGYSISMLERGGEQCLIGDHYIAYIPFDRILGSTNACSGLKFRKIGTVKRRK